MSDANIVNVFVHGLIFMRQNPADKSLLELIVPPLTGLDHLFLGGVREVPDGLISLSANENWSTIGLNGKSAAPPPPNSTISADVPSSVLQFSIKETNLGDWDPASFDGTLTLPWPLAFFSVRCDSFNRAFKYDKTRTTVIGDNIAQHCKGGNPDVRVGFITCLQYTYTKSITIDHWQPGRNLHCYFEPCQKHNIDDVNQDFSDAGDVFTNSDVFDLQMERSAGSIVTGRDQNCSQISGFNKEDDYSLTDDPIAQGDRGVCSLRVQDDQGELPNINPSNCPNFFVGP